MDEEDDKKLYEVQEMQEYADSTGFATNLKADTSQSKDYIWKIFNAIFMIVALLLLLMILILAIYDVSYNGSEDCTGTVTSTAAVTGSNNDACNFTCKCEDNNDAEQKLLKQMINKTELVLQYSYTQAEFTDNNTDSIGETLDILRNTAATLNDVVGTLSNVKDTGIMTEAVVNDIRYLTDQLLKIQNNTYYTEPTSCEDLKSRQPDSTDGYYHINSQIVYCKFGEMCGVTGSWTRVGYLDMGDSTSDCPDGLKYYQSGGVRACGRNSGTANCESVKLSSFGVRYTQVCGRVTGYQYASSDGFLTFINNIESHYVDGVSITQGNPRKHIWTLASGVYDSRSSSSNCPCSSPPGSTSGQLDSFIGTNYFCESGNPNFFWGLTLYTADPLWDGDGCGPQEADCCAAPGLPWFYRNDLEASTEPLELRVCGNQGTHDEDTPISYYEIYVQ